MPRTITVAAKDRYLELVKQFPLRRLKNESERADAVRFLTQTSLKHQGTKDGGLLDYLDTLAHLIDEYERGARLRVDTAHTTPANVIRHLLQANGLSISGLAKQAGIGQSNLSEMLSGQRDFSKDAIAKLSARFGINPAIFF